MKNTANNLTAFKNRIFLYGICIALILEAGSLLFLGFDLGFAYGLALGTAVSVVNFNILAYTSKKLLNNGRAWMGFACYIVRLVVYGFAFYAALRVSLVAALGSALGFLTVKLSIYYVHGIRAPRKTYAEGTLVTLPPQKKLRRKGIMKDIFGSPEDDEEDTDDEPKE
jgi:small basic protein